MAPTPTTWAQPRSHSSNSSSSEETTIHGLPQELHKTYHRLILQLSLELKVFWGSPLQLRTHSSQLFPKATCFGTEIFCCFKTWSEMFSPWQCQDTSAFTACPVGLLHWREAGPVGGTPTDHESPWYHSVTSLGWQTILLAAWQAWCSPRGVYTPLGLGSCLGPYRPRRSHPGTVPYGESKQLELPLLTKDWVAMSGPFSVPKYLGLRFVCFLFFS